MTVATMRRDLAEKIGRSSERSKDPHHSGRRGIAGSGRWAIDASVRVHPEHLEELFGQLVPTKDAYDAHGHTAGDLLRGRVAAAIRQVVWPCTSEKDQS
jgi:hypothetical protein